MYDHLTLLAYLDPGAGSLIIQFLIAGLVSAGYLFRHYVGRAFGWLYRKLGGSAAPAPEAVNPPQIAEPIPAAENVATDVSGAAAER